MTTTGPATTAQIDYATKLQTKAAEQADTYRKMSTEDLQIALSRRIDAHPDVIAATEASIPAPTTGGLAGWKRTSGNSRTTSRSSVEPVRARVATEIAAEVIEHLTGIATADLTSMDRAQISTWIDDVKHTLGY